MNSLPRSQTPIYVVAVCYHMRPNEFIEKLQALASRVGRRLRGIAVSNHAEHPLTSPSSDVQVIRGSNVHLDFSGYFEGLASLTTTHPEVAASNVLFVNDSLFLKHAGGCILRHILELDSVLKQLAVPAIGGKMDPYRAVSLRNPWSGHAGYVSSFCFLLNARAQALLSGLPADSASAGIRGSLPVSDPAWGTGMPPVMREQIRAHLVYEGSPYLWKSAGAASPELIRKKACCVYFEHRLSGAIGAEGAIVPINAGPRARADIFVNETIGRVARSLRGAVG